MKFSKNQMHGSALFNLLGGIIILISVLFLLTKLAGSSYYSEVAETTESATQTRIMPTGQVVVGDGTEPGQRTGKQVFDKVCIQCHAADSATAFAPKVTHNDQWTARIAQGFETLVQHAVNGFKGPDGGNMPAKGGDTRLTDDEVARAVAYMANQSGANFTEPPVGGAAAAASAKTSSAPAAAKAEDKPAATADNNARGKEVFEQTCRFCHGADTAIPNIPRVTHNDEWAPRIKQGEATLVKHAIEGFNAMPAKGGNAALSDDDIKATVQYMVKQSGG
ncbi:c-type cytochrome [Kingella negevensis]|uniref:Cytochrome c-555 n=1 Tax=Kingella negevensis TaxID=1522312 RepID=A0A238TFF9_9NEIS|nr:c-type cytochrome [Kingella negevensis]MDK4696536.1 c-type cytochrome [Kingella negevensis]SNB82452.1 Cytochrome c-555 precursor [Kingella negevensis]